MPTTTLRTVTVAREASDTATYGVGSPRRASPAGRCRGSVSLGYPKRPESLVNSAPALTLAIRARLSRKHSYKHGGYPVLMRPFPSDLMRPFPSDLITS